LTAAAARNIIFAQIIFAETKEAEMWEAEHSIETSATRQEIWPCGQMSLDGLHGTQISSRPSSADGSPPEARSG
jgi:hypothetical protein